MNALSRDRSAASGTAMNAKALRTVAAVRFRLLLQYRAAALAGLATQVFFGAVMVAVLRAFYATAGSRAGSLSLPDAVTYIWLGQALFAMAPWRPDPEVKAMIQSGGIAYELLRPIDLYAWWFARAAPLKTAPAFLRAPPLLALALLFLGLRLPPTAEAALSLPFALAGAVALSCAITVILNITLLWTLSADGAQFAVPVLVMLFSGQLLPLPLFPSWLQPLLAVLPFRGLVDTPLRVWLGMLHGSSALAAMALQWAWVVVLAAFGRGLLAAGLKRVEISGG